MYIENIDSFKVRLCRANALDLFWVETNSDRTIDKLNFYSWHSFSL